MALQIRGSYVARYLLGFQSFLGPPFLVVSLFDNGHLDEA